MYFHPIHYAVLINTPLGGPELLSQLEADSTLTSNKSAKQGLSDMAILFSLLKAYNALDKVSTRHEIFSISFLNSSIQVSFDLSLARGLDYYTGIIYEAIVEGSAPPGFKAANAFAAASEPTGSTVASAAPPKKKSKKPDVEEEEVDESQVGVGSIAAGGRYDGLVGAFLAGAAGVDPSSKEGKKAMGPGGGTPCVGVSIGMDRIFALVWPKWVERGGRAKETMVFVMSAGDGLLRERVGLATELRAVGIKVCFCSFSSWLTIFFLTGDIAL